jgi:predicted aspartyl protease
MKKPQYVGIAGKVVLTCLAMSGASQSLSAQSDVRFRLVNNLIVISLKSNQAGPFDFVLDTGADTTVVDPSVASQLSFVPLDRIRQTTLSSVQTVTRGSIPSLSAGSLQVDNVDVLIQDLSVLRKMDAHIEGIAGQNFLSHFNYLLDYRKHVVRIELSSEIQDTIDGDHVPIDARDNRMLVASEAQSRGTTGLRLLLDSGASSVVLLPRAVQALNPPKQESRFELTSSGKVELHTGSIRVLTVGSQRLHDVVAALLAKEPAERIGDGMLPTALFQALYINNHEGFVVFNPQIRRNSQIR